MPDNWTAPEESGERHLFLLSSTRYPPADSASLGLGRMLVGTVRGTNGEIGSGVYSVGQDGESASHDTVEFLKALREQGLVEKVWEHTEEEFRRITGSVN